MVKQKGTKTALETACTIARGSSYIGTCWEREWRRRNTSKRKSTQSPVMSKSDARRQDDKKCPFAVKFCDFSAFETHPANSSDVGSTTFFPGNPDKLTAALYQMVVDSRIKPDFRHKSFRKGQKQPRLFLGEINPGAEGEKNCVFERTGFRLKKNIQAKKTSIEEKKQKMQKKNMFFPPTLTCALFFLRMAETRQENKERTKDPTAQMFPL